MISVLTVALFLFIHCEGQTTRAPENKQQVHRTSAQVVLTVLYDNYASVSGAKTQNGFSCLIEGIPHTTLFDTGTKPEILFHNIDLLKVDIKEIEWVFLSHSHGDHTGGLMSLLKRHPKVTVFFPESFPYGFVKRIERRKAQIQDIRKPGELSAGVFHTGQMGRQIKEMGMILDTAKGSVLITGCAHPGVVEMIKRAKKVVKKKVYLVLGGFHLLKKSETEIEEVIAEFKKLGVQKVAPTHCTGDKAIELFKKAYGENFVSAGVGAKLSL